MPKQLAKKILLGIFALIFISYNVYIRIFVKRPPQEVSNNLSELKITLFSFFALAFLVLFIINFYKWLCYKNIIKYNERDNFIKRKISPLFQIYILQPFLDSLIILDDFIKHTLLVKFLGKNLKRFIKFIYKNIYFTKKTSINFLRSYLLFILLPKTILLIAFIVDIFIFSKFYFVYRLGFLVLVPIIFNYVLFTYKEFSEYNINFLNIDFVIFKFNDGTIMSTSDHINEAIQEYNTESTERYSYTIIELNEKIKKDCKDDDDITDTIMFYAEQFSFFKKLRTDLAIIDNIKKKYGLIFETFKCLIYFFIWFYVVLYGIGVI